MSLFVCSECRAVDNTALADFWVQSVEDGAEPHRRLCSECLTGKWHGRFPKVEWDGERTVQWRDGSWLNAMNPE